MIFNVLVENKDIFHSFEDVYLFGSSLYKKHPNDIDILLIYDINKITFQSIQIEKEKIRYILYNILGISIDFTILSKKELYTTHFLKNITSYKKLTSIHEK